VNAKRNKPEAHPAERPELLLAWLDGELAAPERSRIDAHLVHCTECASDVRAYRALFAGFDALPATPVAPPSDLTARILAAVEADRATHPVRRPRWLEIAGAAYTGSAAALVAAGIAVFVSPWREAAQVGVRDFVSALFSGTVGAFVGAFDSAVSLLSLGLRAREAASEVLVPLAPLGRSLEVVAAQPELRAGLAAALVLSTALWWLLQRRQVAGPGRMNDVPAFF